MYPFWYYSPRPLTPGEGFRNNKPIEKKEYKDCFNIGETAPDFTLEGVVMGEQDIITLSDYRGQWVALFFYSADFTFI